MASRLRDLELLLANLESQGAVVKRTKNGWHIRFPDGSGSSLHKTPSDWRAMKNFRSIVRQAGLQFPEEGLQ